MGRLNIRVHHVSGKRLVDIPVNSELSCTKGGKDQRFNTHRERYEHMPSFNSSLTIRTAKQEEKVLLFC